jgi:tRNA-modifying protein YgfZ
VSTETRIVPEAFADGPAAVVTTRDVVTATGADTEKFLQGQLSQDINPLAPGESAWSLLLQPQGKVDAWLRVTRIDADTFLLDVDPGYGEAVVARLQRFLLRTKCELTMATWPMVAIRGAGTHGMDIAVESGALVVVPAQWPGIEGVDLLGEALKVPERLATASEADLELLRILCGVPAMGAELDERTIPAEAGIVDRSASFTKGCYTGQELVARIDSRGGNVPRHLRRLTASSAIAPGDPLTLDGADVGRVTSAAAIGDAWVGLGYVRRAVEVPGDVVGPNGAVTVSDLP